MRTDREKHELIGAVKSVRVEKARFDDQGGQLTERPLLSQTSTFNQDGCLIEQVNRNPDRSEWRTINDYSDSGKVDQFLADYLKRTSASLGFVLVKDGKIFFQKGYGYAGIGAAGFLIFLSFPVVSMIGFVRRRWRKARSELQPATGEPHLAWGMATLVSLLVVITPLPVLTWMLFGDHSRPSQFRAAFHISSGALLLAALLGLTLSIFAGVAWKRGDWTNVRRLYYSVVALAALLMVPFLYHWNLLRF